MNRKQTRELIQVARGEVPADLILANTRIVNTFNGEIEQGNIAIHQGHIAGIGDYRDGVKTIDLAGKYVAPGFIDGHTHVESSMLHITQYARAVVPRGTLALVTDLHEIANVCGLDGAGQILRISEKLPLDVFFMVPSCVPATHLETSGARITADDVQSALAWKNSIGLGEMMNFPGVLYGDAEVLLKLSLSRGKAIDGHAPGLHGRDLNAYLTTGIGSDHESTTLDEAREKLSRGMWVMIREGSSEKNLATLLPLVNDRNYHRCFFVVDDRSCVDLLQDGDIDAVVRKAIRLGLDPVRAIGMATINTAQYFRLQGLGAVAPGYLANLIVFSDLAALDIGMVFYRGELVARDKQAVFSADVGDGDGLTHTVNIKDFGVSALKIPAERRNQPVIEVVPGQIITRKITVNLPVKDGAVSADPAGDILKLVVVERHRGSGNIGVGLVKGFGLKQGALASSIAHDSHNIIAAGADDKDLIVAIKEIEKLQGGLVVAAQGKIIAALPLPIAGLLSDEPLETVVKRLHAVEDAARGLGCALASPFSTLSFLALPVIPELRLTDLGLVDVGSFRLLQ